MAAGVGVGWIERTCMARSGWMGIGMVWARVYMPG